MPLDKDLSWKSGNRLCGSWYFNQRRLLRFANKLSPASQIDDPLAHEGLQQFIERSSDRLQLIVSRDECVAFDVPNILEDCH